MFVKAILPVFKIILILEWIGLMVYSDSYLLPYVIVGFAGILFIIGKTGKMNNTCNSALLKKGFDRINNPDKTNPFDMAAIPDKTNPGTGLEPCDIMITAAFSVLFVFFVLSANYELYQELVYAIDAPVILKSAYKLFLYAVSAAGAYVSCFEVLGGAAACLAKHAGGKAWQDTSSSKKRGEAPERTSLAANGGEATESISLSTNAAGVNGKRVFLISFAVISCTYLAVLFLCKYPGNLLSDSIDHIDMVYGPPYSNHHPFLYTIIIGIFYRLGFLLTGSSMGAVCFFNCVQVLLVAAAFAYGVMTLYERTSSLLPVGAKSRTASNAATADSQGTGAFAGFSGLTAILCTLFFAFVPCNIMLSFTITKDTLFSTACLVFMIAFYRLSVSTVGASVKIDNILFCISSLQICLLRTNGWYAFFGMCLLGVLVLLAKNKRNTVGFLEDMKQLKLGIMLTALIVTYLLKGPVLSMMGVVQPDSAESLAIPLQQIGRAYAENGLPDKERDQLGRFMDVDQIPERYDATLADGMKNLVRETGQNYLKENMGEFLSLYVSLGIKYPESYFAAWVDQTRGYFNSGYRNKKWNDLVHANNAYGLERRVFSEKAGVLFDFYCRIFEENPVTQLLMAIGLLGWLYLAGFYLCIIKRDLKMAFLLFLPICVTATLLIATPMYAAVRYGWHMFTCLPALILAVLHTPSEPLINQGMPEKPM